MKLFYSALMLASLTLVGCGSDVTTSKPAENNSKPADNNPSPPAEALAIAEQCFVEMPLGESTSHSWSSDCTSFSREAYIDPYSPEPIEHYSRYANISLDQLEDLGFSVYGGSSVYLYLLDKASGEVLKKGFERFDTNAIEAGDYVLEISSSRLGAFTVASTKIDFGSDECYLPVTLDQTTSSSWRPDCTSNIRDFADPYQESNATAHRARFFTFDVGNNGDLDIQVNSSSSHYLYLYEGNSDATTPIFSGAELETLSLEPGSYTLEVAGYSKDDVGTVDVLVQQIDTNTQCQQVAQLNTTINGGWISSCAKRSPFSDYNDPYTNFETAYARYYTLGVDALSDFSLRLSNSEYSGKAITIYAADDLSVPLDFYAARRSQPLLLDMRMAEGEYVIEILSDTLAQYSLLINKFGNSTGCDQPITPNETYIGLSTSDCPMVHPIGNNDPYASKHVSNRFSFSLTSEEAISVSLTGAGELDDAPKALYRSLPNKPSMLIDANYGSKISGSSEPLLKKLGQGDYFVDLWVPKNSSPHNFSLNVKTGIYLNCEQFLPLGTASNGELNRFCESLIKPRDYTNFDPYVDNSIGYYYAQRYTFFAAEDSVYQLEITANFTPEVRWWPSAKRPTVENTKNAKGSIILMNMVAGYHTLEVTSISPNSLGNFTVEATKQ